MSCHAPVTYRHTLVSNDDDAACLEEVAGHPPLPECQQNQGAYCELCQEMMEVLYRTANQQDTSGEGEQLQVPLCTYYVGLNMDYTY